MKIKSTRPVISKAEQRVAIAKDVLLQLRNEKIIAETGSYIRSELVDELEDLTIDDDIRKVQAQAYLMKIVNPCRVCAKGALFLSAVRKYNKATVDAVMCGDMGVAERIFGIRQFDQIEAAFEQWENARLRNESDDEGEPTPKAYQFGMRYEDDEDRLVAILKNIIKNNGDFKP